MEALKGIDSKQQEIIEDFSLFEGDKEQSIDYIMDLGSELEPLDEEFHQDEFLITGCQSKVWLIATLEENGLLRFKADSNTLLTKGLISLLTRVYSGEKPADVENTEPYFLKEIGMDQLVGSQRSNGLSSMVQRIKEYAHSFADGN